MARTVKKQHIQNTDAAAYAYVEIDKPGGCYIASKKVRLDDGYFFAAGCNVQPPDGMDAAAFLAFYLTYCGAIAYSATTVAGDSYASLPAAPRYLLIGTYASTGYDCTVEVSY
jgi:hypothetical protein